MKFCSFSAIGQFLSLPILLSIVQPSKMQKTLIHSILFLGLLLLTSCNGVGESFTNVDDFDQYLQEEIEKQNIPAISSLIFKRDEILHETILGSAQLEPNIALEKDHLFLLASVSKVITASALLQLNEDGLFTLDEKIENYLPFGISKPNDGSDITFRMLLTHTSGIADGSSLDDQYYYGEDSPVELGFFLKNYLELGGEFYSVDENFHDFAPGEAHEYSNVGNALIGLLVEEISGLNFNQYCKENIFVPLAMTNTYWRLDEISGTIVQPYNYVSGDFEAIGHYTFTDYPNGGLRSNCSDMFKFISAFVLDGMSNGNELLTQSTIDAMLTPQILTLDQDMGLHLFRMNAENNLWGHDGGEQGVATIMAFNPETKVGAVILTNQGDANLDEILVEAYQLGLRL